MKTARYWTAAENGAVQCDLCPHRCRIAEGQRGRCHVRLNQGGVLIAETWGHPVAMQVDPIEKKPLNHFLPGSRVLSLGTLGCNLSCRFCQNWELSHPDRKRASTGKTILPEDVAQLALTRGIPSVAATYNEPTVWAEYALDIADACHEKGVRMVAVSSGYFAEASRLDFFSKMDAANVDLKSFRDDFYRRLCGARLAPVLETLLCIRRETSCWLEVTTLLIPGENDSEAELDELTAWVAEHLGEGTPLHFSAFHPDGEMEDVPRTPSATMRRARERAFANGLRHVYIGNMVGEPEWTATFCPSCGARLVTREGFSAEQGGLDPAGACAQCGQVCEGVWS
ncbi:MAG: AmmeMemoRadiSam system radical SAM enzyme [Kiritimatiellia bacterium]|jgi:pyruvate formate lyase activating enzyme|nr:AmmeMemoRadiSam system radical SAM enzyme [Kiritimatiellia bacterium]